MCQLNYTAAQIRLSQSGRFGLASFMVKPFKNLIY
jgi:hypothetical protein